MIPIFLFLIGFVIIFDTSFKKTEGHPDKKWLIHSLKIHFSEKCSRDNFYGHVRSREGTWAIKNQVPIKLFELKKGNDFFYETAAYHDLGYHEYIFFLVIFLLE